MNCQICKQPMVLGQEDGKPIRYCTKCGRVVQLPMAGATMKHEAGARVARAERVNKYGNVKTEVDGILFDSAAEARRYSELVLLAKSGLITHLWCQPEFDLNVNGVKVGKYIADFKYTDCRTDKQVIEDVKGMRTPVYKLKKKLVEAIYGIKIVEVE